MKKRAILSGLISFLCAIRCFGQMTADQAVAALQQREAERAVAATQPDALEQQIADLKEANEALREKNDALTQENQRLRYLVPEVPKAGWNFSRVQNAQFARVLSTGDVFNIDANGKLQNGTAGDRVVLTSANMGIAGTTSFQHSTEPQVALYNVFLSNGTPYDPSMTPQDNIKHMNDAYVVLVNVDTGHIDFADKNDDIWNDVLDNQPKQETTLIMQETTTLIIEGPSN